MVFFFFFPLTEQEALQSFGLETLECFVLVGNLEMKLFSIRKPRQTISFWVDLNLCYPKLLQSSVVVVVLACRTTLTAGTLKAFGFLEKTHLCNILHRLDQMVDYKV